MPRNNFVQASAELVEFQCLHFSDTSLLIFQDIWGYMRASAVRKVEKSNQSGAGGSKLTELDNIILDVIGRESSYLNGLNQADEAPAFGAQSLRPGTSRGNFYLNLLA